MKKELFSCRVRTVSHSDSHLKNFSSFVSSAQQQQKPSTRGSSSSGGERASEALDRNNAAFKKTESSEQKGTKASTPPAAGNTARKNKHVEKWNDEQLEDDPSTRQATAGEQNKLQLV